MTTYGIDGSRSVVADPCREIAGIIGYSSLPDAIQMRDIGLFATYEMSFMRVLDSYSDELIDSLLSALRTAGDPFLKAVTQLMFVNLSGWLKVTKLDSRGLMRLETIIKYASACESAPHPYVLRAAKAVNQWNLAMTPDETEVVVAVVAAAHVYAEKQNEAWKHFPKEDSGIIQYSIDNRADYKRIAAIVKQRGCDLALVEAMLEAPPALSEGAL